MDRDENTEPAPVKTEKPDREGINIRLAALEERERETHSMIKDIHVEVVGGTGGKIGLGETQREQGKRIERLERWFIWIGAVNLGVATLVIGAWAIHFIGPATPPTVIYQQMPAIVAPHK